MLSEFLREAGLLVLVLAPLESIVDHGGLTLTEAAVTLVVALPSLALGLLLGLERP